MTEKMSCRHHHAYPVLAAFLRPLLGQLLWSSGSMKELSKNSFKSCKSDAITFSVHALFSVTVSHLTKAELSYALLCSSMQAALGALHLALLSCPVLYVHSIDPYLCLLTATWHPCRMCKDLTPIIAVGHFFSHLLHSFSAAERRSSASWVCSTSCCFVCPHYSKVSSRGLCFFWGNTSKRFLIPVIRWEPRNLFVKYWRL